MEILLPRSWQTSTIKNDKSISQRNRLNLTLSLDFGSFSRFCSSDLPRFQYWFFQSMVTTYRRRISEIRRLSVFEWHQQAFGDTRLICCPVPFDLNLIQMSKVPRDTAR